MALLHKSTKLLLCEFNKLINIYSNNIYFFYKDMGNHIIWQVVEVTKE